MNYLVSFLLEEASCGPHNLELLSIVTAVVMGFFIVVRYLQINTMAAICG